MKLSSAITGFPIFTNIKRRILPCKKGFLTVEAAIFLPVFIAGILTLAYLIKFMAIEEGVFHSFADQARVLSAVAGKDSLRVPVFAQQTAFEQWVKNRIYEENGDNVSKVDLDMFLYLYDDPLRDLTEVISMDLNYEVNVKLPISFRKNLPVSESLLFRGFVGKRAAIDPMPFEEMETEKKSDPVWVFPISGERYHGENCTYIVSEPKQVIMSVQVRRSYGPCGICDSRNLPNGSLAYCFRTGNSYHTGKCPTVEKYVIRIEREEAIENGYTACFKCGGN